MRIAWALSWACVIASVGAIKFELPATRNPSAFCIWNYAMADTLAIISINVSPRDPHTAAEQSIDVKVVDRTHHNVYLSKKGLKDETRLAINTHHDADLGVCLSNRGKNDDLITDIDLDVHLGGDAVDYNAIANQESLSGMETELRKLATTADEILEEMEYLKKREKRLSQTNGMYLILTKTLHYVVSMALPGFRCLL